MREAKNDDDAVFLDPAFTRNPLLDFPLPTINPFLVVARAVCSKGAMTYDDAEEVVGKTLEEEVVRSNTTSLRLAGDNGNFNVKAEHRHEDAALRHITASLVMKYHYLTEDQIAELAVPQLFLDTGSDLTRRNRLTHFDFHARCFTISWHVAGLMRSVSPRARRTQIDLEIDCYEAYGGTLDGRGRDRL